MTDEVADSDLGQPAQRRDVAGSDLAYIDPARAAEFADLCDLSAARTAFCRRVAQPAEPARNRTVVGDSDKLARAQRSAVDANVCDPTHYAVLFQLEHPRRQTINQPTVCCRKIICYRVK